jgi:hypothetical protein
LKGNRIVDREIYVIPGKEETGEGGIQKTKTVGGEENQRRKGMCRRRTGKSIYMIQGSWISDEDEAD